MVARDQSEAAGFVAKLARRRKGWRRRSRRRERVRDGVTVVATALPVAARRVAVSGGVG